MTCEELERKMLTGAALSESESRHVAGCRGCREFRELLSRLNGGPFPEPSPRVDGLVLGMASRELSRIRRRRVWCRFGSVAAVACAAFLAVVWWPSSDSVLRPSPEPVEARRLDSGDSVAAALAREDMELSELEWDFELLSSVPDWEDGLLAESDESSALLPASELSGLGDALYEMEQMVKDL